MLYVKNNSLDGFLQSCCWDYSAIRDSRYPDLTCDINSLKE